jgi:hypothetical protein
MSPRRKIVFIVPNISASLFSIRTIDINRARR